MPAYPEDHYLLALGRYVYAATAIEGLVLGEIAIRKDDLAGELERTELASKTMGQLGTALSGASVSDPDLAKWIAEAGRALSAAAIDRNNALHAQPATQEDGAQRLHRWAPKHKTFHFVTPEWLAERTAELEAEGNRLSSSRPPRRG